MKTMNHVIKMLALAGMTVGAALAADAGAVGKSTPAGFTDDFEAAKIEAAKSGRNVLAVFSGSDWCYWCKVLERDYLSKSEFVEEAKKDFVLVFIDIPHDQSVLSETAKKNNEALTKRYKIRGFPTVKILDAKGEPITDCRPEDDATPKDYALQLRREVKVGPLLQKYLAPFEEEKTKTMVDAFAEVEKEAQEIEETKEGEEVEKAQFELMLKVTSKLVGKIKALVEKVKAAQVPDEIQNDKASLLNSLTDTIEQMEETLKMTWDDVEKMKEQERKKRSRAADSDDKAIEIAPERQAEIEKAESAYLRRQLYEPVVKALEAEQPETREAWKDILTTADSMLDELDNRQGFSLYREFAGSGAVTAYTNGCHYPVPIAFAFASKLKRSDKIQAAYSNLHESVKNDTRWNPASRMTFYGMMSIVDHAYGKEISNSPPSLTNACREALAEATYEFLKAKDYAPDEIGMAFHLVRYNGQQHGVLAKVYERLKAEGVAIDPWLDLMLQAQIAHRKAWDARGEGFANTVTPEGWAIYKEEIDKVFPLLEKAYQLRPEQAWSCALALDAALGDGYARELWLRRLLACRPGETAGLGVYLWGLRPRWGGTSREMAQFLLGLVKRRQFDTMVPIFAYERIVDDVFTDEGGVALDDGSSPNVDKFVLACRKHFEPYLEVYRTNNLEATLPFVQKVHFYLALADLAWRLENENELLYWAEKFEATKIPVYETEFAMGYDQYSPYLAALRKLEGTKRHDFLVGLHALYIDGEPKAIDRMRAIAEEIGEDKLAFECALVRKGKVNLIPFLDRGKTAHSAKDMRIDFKGRQRDHMLFRVRLRASEGGGSTYFYLEVLHGVKERWRKQYGNCIEVKGSRGEKAGIRKEAHCGVEWPKDQETCAFEFEIVGNRARITQNGVCLMESPLSDIPSQCDSFHANGYFGDGLEMEKFELEVLDSKDFVIQSVPKNEMSPTEPNAGM